MTVASRARPRSTPRPPARRQGPAQAPAGSRCNCGPRGPVARVPCSLRVAKLWCQHCATSDRRYRGLEWAINARGNPQPVNAASSARIENARFDVVASPQSRYRDVLRLQAFMSVCAHPAVHPQFRVTGGPEGTRTAQGAERIHNCPVSYHDWFAAIRRLGWAGLFRLFFPGPRNYQAHIVSCGARPNAPGWSEAIFYVGVYPGDKFKLTLNLPALSSSSRGGTEGRVGASTYQEAQRASSNQSGGQSRTVRVSQENGRTTRQSTRSVTGPAGGTSRTVTQSGSARDVAEATNPASNPRYVEAIRSIKLERESADITTSFQLSRFIECVLTVRRILTDIFDFFRRAAEAFPEIGWRYAMSFELFGGSLEMEWQWRENPLTNRAWKFFKIDAELRIIRFTFTISFGATIFGAGARIQFQVQVDLYLGAHGETRPDRAVNIDVRARLVGNGTLSAFAGWESTLSVEGSVTTGLQGLTRIFYSDRFRWTIQAKLKEAKGDVKLTVFGWERSRSWTFWDDWTFLPERSLLPS